MWFMLSGKQCKPTHVDKRSTDKSHLIGYY
jgi:hypothetical protein